MPRARFLLLIFLTILAFCREDASARHRPAPKKPSKSRSSERAAKKIGKERSAKEDELGALQKEIEHYRSELARHEQLEQKSKHNLSAFNKRTAELESAINSLETRIDALSERKTEVDQNLKQTTTSLDKLKEAYANGSRYLYMKGGLRKPSADLYMFAPEREAEFQKNSYYAHLIGEAHAMNRGKLDSMKRSLGESSKQIANTMNSEEQQIGASAQEEQSIERKKEEEARALDQIQQNKERLRKLLQQRTASAKRLEGIIANLVVKEEAARKSMAKSKALARKKEYAESRKTTRHGKAPVYRDEPADEPEPGRSYGPHSLLWPSSSHHIKQGFGEHRNAQLNTVTMNLGVDIAASEGSTVFASAEGSVSLVSTLPSYGTIIVLEHSSGLHTVYADLSGASVHAGQRVRAGQQIGRSGSNEENGAVLHFEVWKGKSKQNPMGWLR